MPLPVSTSTSIVHSAIQRRSQKFVLGVGINFLGGGIKLNTHVHCSIVILTLFLPHKKSTWTDFEGLYIPIYPVATPLALL